MWYVTFVGVCVDGVSLVSIQLGKKKKKKQKNLTKHWPNEQRYRVVQR